MGSVYRFAFPLRRSNIKTHVIVRRALVAKPNYRHAKKQKEAARKARQDAKQQRRSSTPETAFVADAPVEPVPVKSAH
jgi:hypothetical protein